MGLSSLIGDLDDWCGTPPGRPPRPPWLGEMMTAVVLAELAGSLDDSYRSDASRELYQMAARMYESVAEKVALNPQPLPPLEEQ